MTRSRFNRNSSIASGMSIDETGNGKSTETNILSSSSVLNKLNAAFAGRRSSISGTGKSGFGSSLSIFSRNMRPRRHSRIRRSNSRQSFLSTDRNGLERGTIMTKVRLDL